MNKKILQTEKYYKNINKLILKNYELEDKIYILQEGIESIIYQIEHNPRTNAETRDKYIIEQLNNLLKGD